MNLVTLENISKQYSERQLLNRLNLQINQDDSRNSTGSDYVALQRLADQLQAVETEVETIMERWLELSEIAEGSHN